jgi:L-tartrate/succinate antiporter
VEFAPWVAAAIKPLVASLDLPLAAVFLITIFFFAHYLFATISGHATALLPLFLMVAVWVPGLSPKGWALALAYTFGMMGILTPYATGPSPVYYGCGYISRAEFWLLGLLVGVVFLGTYLLVGVPWLIWRTF